MKRLPRKLKKRIPKGLYCYDFLSYDKDKHAMLIKPCLFYKYLEDEDSPENYVGYCKFMKLEIDDQCKTCGINGKI